MSRLYCCSVRSCFCLTLYNVHNIFTLSKGFQFVWSWCRLCAIYFVGFIYIHDYMGPGYVGAACCTILCSLNYFRLTNVFNILIIILQFSIIIKNIVFSVFTYLTELLKTNKYKRDQNPTKLLFLDVTYQSLTFTCNYL